MNFRFLKFPLFPFLLLSLSLVSCQKEISVEDINNVNDYVRDSTLLIKSVGLYDFTLQDSIIESYSYDSANRKVTLTWTNPSASFFPDGTTAELSYNSDWMISHIKYIYPAGYTPQASDYKTADITYDAEKILQKITLTYGDGTVEPKVYTRTPLASG